MRRIHLCFLLIATTGCAEGSVAQNGDGADGGRDGLTTLNDPDNCGKRGHVCVARGETACYAGKCRCNGPADCHLPDECRDGICQAPDADGRKCFNDSECPVKQYCITRRCTPQVCIPETCDGFDNDCDGQTDEAAETDLECYTGPAHKLGIGACRAGVRKCEAGKYTACLGEHVPHPEIGRFSCDGEDSDCDGCIDATGGATLGCTPAHPPTADIVFMIDRSGSMQDKIDAAKMTIDSVTGKRAGDPRFRYGIVDVTDPLKPGRVSVLQPITDYVTFKAKLDTIMADGAGDEPTYDAVLGVSRGDFDAELGFRSDSYQVYIVFGDENAQTTPMLSTTETAACKALDARSALLIVLTLPGYFSDWDECAAKYSFELSADVTVMAAALDGALNLACFR